MIDNKHLKDQQDIADAFNNYFSSIIDKISKNNVNNKTNNEKISTFHYYLEQNYVHPPPSFVIKTFSTKEITSIIKALKTKKLSWVWWDFYQTIKISATYVCSQLTYICNKSILSGTFHDRMKFSIIKTIYKKGNKINPTNYRPISLLTSFSMVFEKALYIWLTEHFNTNKLLVGNQFGFKKGVAREDAIFKLTNEIIKCFKQ